MTRGRVGFAVGVLVGIAIIAVAARVFVPAGAPPVASSPTPTASASVAPSPSPTPSARDPQLVLRVYFARDSLPPVGADVRRPFQALIRETRIAERVLALAEARPSDVPAGAGNAFDGVLPAGARVTVGARIDRDVATVSLESSGGWLSFGTAGEAAFIQQLVYTITEEPGVRSALLRKRDGTPFETSHGIFDRPLTREDVSGYDLGDDATEVITYGNSGLVADLGGLGAIKWSVDEIAPALARVILELRPVPGAPPPLAVVRAERVDDQREAGDGKWRLRVDLPDVRWVQAAGEAFHCCPGLLVERTPLRRISVGPSGSGPRGVTVTIHLDDLRPWRVINVHGSPHRFTIDVGGHPQALSQSVIVHSPPRGAEVARQFRVSGAVRSFEATVQWRLRDQGGTYVARGFGTASEGTSPAWGLYELDVSVPASVSGNAQLEVYWGSPRDGSEQGTVAIPLRVR